MKISIGLKTYMKRKTCIIKILLKLTKLPDVLIEEIVTMALQSEIYEMLNDLHNKNEENYHMIRTKIETMSEYFVHIQQRFGTALEDFSNDNYFWMSPYHTFNTLLRRADREVPSMFQTYVLNMNISIHQFSTQDITRNTEKFLEVAKIVRKTIQSHEMTQKHTIKSLDIFYQRLQEAILLYEVSIGTVA